MAPRETDVLGTQDLVGRVVLEHAMLMDAGLVREGILAYDGLVPGYRHAGDVGNEPRGGIEPVRLDSRAYVEEGRARLQRHHDLFE